MNALSSAIYTQLVGGTALTALLHGGTAGTAVYEDHAPDSAELPYVVFNTQSVTWDYTMGVASTNRFADVIYQVKAVTDEAYPKTAATIDEQIDVRLHNASLSVTGYGLLRIVRESDIQFSEISDGQIIQHHGALYRVELQKS